SSDVCSSDLHAPLHDPVGDGPNDDEGNEDLPLNASESPETLGNAEIMVEEESFRVLSPLGSEGIVGVAERPPENRHVVRDYKKGHDNLPPADPFRSSANFSKSERRRSLIFVADHVLQEQNRNPRGQQGDKIGNQKGAASVFIHHVRITPDVSQSDRRTDRGKNKARFRRPTFSLFHKPSLLHSTSHINILFFSTYGIPYSTILDKFPSSEKG